MKTALKLFFCSVGSSLLLTNCIDSNKDLFDMDQTAGLYEETFPVKNIDPNMDWVSIASATAAIGISEDEGVDYKIRIFDEYPLVENSSARLLAEGIANNKMPFNTTFDLPKAMDVVYVVRTDEKKRHTVKVVSVKNNAVTANFSNIAAQTRNGNNGDFVIAPMDAPYSDAEAQALLNSAVEVQAGWNLSAGFDWDNGKYKDYPIFNTPNDQPRYFKITTPQTNTFSIGQDLIVKVLISSKLTITNWTQFNGNTELIVLSGGEIELNNTLNLQGSGHITVLNGGKITGTGSITFNNASEGLNNYNGGDITLNTITLNCSNGYFYNAGTLNLTKLDITNKGTKLVNKSYAKIDNVSHSNTTIDNGCVMTIEQFKGNLNVGPNTNTKINKFNDNTWDKTISISSNAILNIEDAFLSKAKFISNSNDYGLVKIQSITGCNGFSHSGKIYYEINNIANNVNDWEQGFLNPLKNTDGQLSKFGDSPIYIPAGDCTGEGNRPNDMGEEITDTNPMKFTYTYEDNFPSPGDYDFNDIVMDVSTTYTKGEANKIQKIHYHVTLTAVGSSKQVGAALRLVGINKSDITNIEFGGDVNMRNSLANSVFENTTTEEGDNNIVIPLFGDAHAVYGYADKRTMLNTQTAKTSDIYTLEVILTLADQTKTSPLLGKDNLDFFIGYKSLTNKRTEVHLFEFLKYDATAKGNIYKVNLEAAGRRTWAVCVPEFKYPRESVSITEAYPSFEQWAQNMDTNQDWYNHPTDKTDKKYIY